MARIRRYFNDLHPETKNQIKNIVRENQEWGWAAIKGYAKIADVLFPCNDLKDVWGRHQKEDRWAGYLYHYVSNILFYEDFGYSITELYKTA